MMKQNIITKVKELAEEVGYFNIMMSASYLWKKSFTDEPYHTPHDKVFLPVLFDDIAEDKKQFYRNVVENMVTETK